MNRQPLPLNNAYGVYIYIYCPCPWEDLETQGLGPDYYVYKRPQAKTIGRWLKGYHVEWSFK